MEANVIAVVVFTCSFAGALLGMWLRSVLPEHHFDAESKDTVKVGIGLIATMTALVLGLVTASAKNSFDEVNAGVKQAATQILSLDRALARYGSETGGIREGLKQAVATRIEILWPQGSSSPLSLEPAHVPQVEGLAEAIRNLVPKDDSQRSLQDRALDIAEDLLEQRWLVIADSGASVPGPFLVVLLFWLSITFASFGLFAPRNAMVVTVLFVCAVSVTSAVFLVLEMDGPFEGLLRASPDPLRAALAYLGR